jgi:hypothetical protein
MTFRWTTVVLALAMAAVAVLVGSLVLGMRGEDPASPAQGGTTVPGRDGIRVEVLNASGVGGVARRGTERLRARGFDVVFYGNATGFHPDSSVVLDRLGNPEAARAVARGVGVERVLEAPDTTLYLDVTVILGRDWADATSAH